MASLVTIKIYAICYQQVMIDQYIKKKIQVQYIDISSDQEPAPCKDGSIIPEQPVQQQVKVEAEQSEMKPEVSKVVPELVQPSLPSLPPAPDLAPEPAEPAQQEAQKQTNLNTNQKSSFQEIEYQESSNNYSYQYDCVLFDNIPTRPQLPPIRPPLAHQPSLDQTTTNLAHQLSFAQTTTKLIPIPAANRPRLTLPTGERPTKSILSPSDIQKLVLGKTMASIIRQQTKMS